jgi:hypothetical protein
LAINFEVYIYNDVVALEIHHPTLHQMMRQFYEAMWQRGQPLEITQ